MIHFIPEGKGIHCGFTNLSNNLLKSMLNTN